MTNHCLIRQGERCSDATANSLDKQTQEITSHEEESVSSSPDSTNLFPIDNYNSPQTEIYRSSHEHWTQSQADQIHEKVCPVERIAIHEDSSNVSRRLTNESQDHGDADQPRLVLDPENQLCKCEHVDDDEKQNIAGH